MSKRNCCSQKQRPALKHYAHEVGQCSAKHAQENERSNCHLFGITKTLFNKAPNEEREDGS